MNKIEFRDLKKQYYYNKEKIDRAIETVLKNGSFIGGEFVTRLEEELAEYVGMKYCISCANGTDALQLAMMAWDIKKGDAVFVPDFTFFSTAEVVSTVGATPIFVEVRTDTYNIDVGCLEKAVEGVIREGCLVPKAIIAVDLFGQPAEYDKIRKIAEKHNLFLLEDGAQGFGGQIREKRACSFGDISTTSFFPAKPLGCYGDGGAIFTDCAEWAEKIKSLKVHGKGTDKYDNVYIGMNSRLDTLQAAILLEKFPIFYKEELKRCNEIAMLYTENLTDVVEVPRVLDGMVSSWAQYTIKLKNKKTRDIVAKKLAEEGVPTAVYYVKPMHKQRAFEYLDLQKKEALMTQELCDVVLSLPMHPYLSQRDVIEIARSLREVLEKHEISNL